MKRAVVALVAAAAMCASASAAETLRGGSADHRIRHVNYDPEQVVRLTGFYGYHTAVAFASGEKVVSATAGYADGWDVGIHGHYITVKPRAEHPDTSLVVVSDRRTYVFDLRAKMPPAGRVTAQYAADPDQVWLLRFRYPDDERAITAAAQASADAAQLAAEARAAELRTKLQAAAALPPKPHHREYYYEGEDAIAPYEAWDDGTFTYLRFYAESDLPSPFVVNDDGTESTANKHFDRDVMVIERTARRLVLRKGRSVACIYNENAPTLTPQPTSGATVPGAERIVK